MTTFEERLKEAFAHSYDIERELGGAGMSRVFVATDKTLGRKIVIKLLSPELTADVNRGRFRREIQVAAQLQHPHIVPLLSAGEHEDLLYFTMPFIKGESLKSMIEKNGPMQVEDVVRVMYHVGEALDYAHGQGVVHRDIKPANILMSGTYSLITDFGVAKALNAASTSGATAGVTATGTAVGTPSYMAPEQLAGDSSADHRIDIYAVGLLAYELLHGRSPFISTTPQRTLANVLTLEPKPLVEVRPEVPRSLSETVMRCLSKEPDGRPESARALLYALDTFSTASGEIRTTEHRVPRVSRTPQYAVPGVPTPNEITSGGQPTQPSSVTQPTLTVPPTTPSQHVPAYESYPQPKKANNKMLLIGGGLLVPIAAIAIYMAMKSDNAPAPVVAPATDSVPVVASAPVDSLPAAAIDSTAVAAPIVDSAAIKDSIRKRRALRDSLKKAQAARDSALLKLALPTTGPTPMGKARNAAAGMLSNAAAAKKFNDGATHKGGVLGTRNKGDLQTQIDALAPYLSQAGLTYDQFKSLVRESGVSLFDEFGRMLPSAMQRFASGG